MLADSSAAVSLVPDRATRLAHQLVDTLPKGLDTLFNPWRDPCEGDTALNDAAARFSRLVAHLDCNPAFVLVGEAAGYQGMRRSGLAFTSERQLLEGAIPRVPTPAGRLTMRALPWSEPSATIVWRTLKELGIEDSTILWNALPLHPHRPGDFESNRTPTDAELEMGRAAMGLLHRAFPNAQLVAVGRKAQALLAAMKLPSAGCVRHPANGGATRFAKELASLVAQSAPASPDPSA